MASNEKELWTLTTQLHGLRSKVREATATRNVLCAEMHEAGYSFRWLGKVLDVNQSSACNMVRQGEEILKERAVAQKEKEAEDAANL